MNYRLYDPLQRYEMDLDKREETLNNREKFLYNNVDELLRELLDLKLSLNSNDVKVIDKKFDVFQNILNSLKHYENNEDQIQQNKKIAAQRHVVKSLLTPEKKKKLDATPNKFVKKSRELRYSCEDFFNGSTYGYPFYKTGFVRKLCIKTPIYVSTSLIIDRPMISKGSKYTFPGILDSASKAFKDVFLIVEKKDEDIIKKFVLPKNI